MKKLFPFLFLIGCSNTSYAEPLYLFDTSILLNESCVVVASKDSTSQSYKIPFSDIGKCRIVTHDNTNIPNIKYVNGMYVLFIENNVERDNNCRSEYSAIGISNDGSMHITEKVKRSSSCYQGKESKSFEYFSNVMSLHN